jgi:hypothetical protein
MQSLKGLTRHWALVFRTASGQPVAHVGRTVVEVRGFVRQCALVELLRWACEQAVQGRSVAEISAALGLPA